MKVLAKEKRLRRCFPRCHFAVNGNTVLHLSGPRGSLVQTRGPQVAPRRGSGAAKEASPTMLVDTTLKSRNLRCPPRSLSLDDISRRYVAREEIARGKMRSGEREERRSEEIGGIPRLRKRKRPLAADWLRRFKTGLYEGSGMFVRPETNQLVAAGGPMEGAEHA